MAFSWASFGCVSCWWHCFDTCLILTLPQEVRTQSAFVQSGVRLCWQVRAHSVCAFVWKLVCGPYDTLNLEERQAPAGRRWRAWLAYQAQWLRERAGLARAWKPSWRCACFALPKALGHSLTCLGASEAGVRARRPSWRRVCFALPALVSAPASQARGFVQRVCGLGGRVYGTAMAEHAALRWAPASWDKCCLPSCTSMTRN